MKILYVITSLSGGGAEKLMNDLLPLVKVDNEVDILILTDKNAKYICSLSSKGIQISVVPANIRSHIGKMKFVAAFIRQHEYDVVHANLFPVTYYCSMIKRFWRGKQFVLVMTEHNTYNNRRARKYLRPLERFIYRAYDHVISISEQTQSALLQWLRCSEDKKRFSVVPNGIPLDTFYEAQPYDKGQLIDGWTDDDVCIAMVGSFTQQKNHSFMVEVMQQLPERYHLLLVGEGPLQDEIETKVRSLNLNNRIHFLGFRSDIAQIMKTADVVVIPSKWEGFGLVAVEAMACGTPVVASDVPGLSEVVGDFGSKVSLGDVGTFSTAIIDVGEENVCISQQVLMDRARIYSIESMAREYLTRYLRLLR